MAEQKLSDQTKARPKKQRFKPDAEFDAAAEGAQRAAAAQLKGIVGRLDRIEDEKQALAEEARGVLIEAKGAGFAPKAVKRAVKILRMDSEERAAMRSLEATVDLYLGLVESEEAES